MIASVAAILMYLGRHAAWMIPVAVTVLALGLGTLAWIGSAGVTTFPLMRRRGVNLQATRGSAEPSLWLVAHIDSKWQPVSMIARVVGVVGTAVSLIAMLVSSLVSARGAEIPAAVILVCCWVFASALMLSVVEFRNTGALDNASGVAAVLTAAQTISADAAIGVLITDAEELALAGARAWARSRPAGVAVNCDSIDDAGDFTLMYSGSRPAALVSRVAAAGSSLSTPIRVRRLIPGVLTDSVALADADWQTVTLSRGDVRTLQRIHTSRDTLAHMHGTGIARAADVMVRTVVEWGGGRSAP